MKYILFLIVVLLVLPTPAVADNSDLPPVQVETHYEQELMGLWDCYPLAKVSGEPEIVVYVNYPEGFVGFSCVLVGGGSKLPFSQNWIYEPISFPVPDHSHVSS